VWQCQCLTESIPPGSEPVRGNEERARSGTTSGPLGPKSNVQGGHAERAASQKLTAGFWFPSKRESSGFPELPFPDQPILLILALDRKDARCRPGDVCPRIRPREGECPGTVSDAFGRIESHR